MPDGCLKCKVDISTKPMIDGTVPSHDATSC